MTIALRFAARSNLGLGSKTRNEDSAFASPDLLVLADGMGGHAAGDTASATVVAELMTLDGESWGADEAAHQLRQAVRRANDRLRQMMDTDLDTEGMGTTLIAFIRSGTKLAMANIGDSRAYLVRDGVFTQLTKDHSVVQALLDEGRITPDEAELVSRGLVAYMIEAARWWADEADEASRPSLERAADVTGTMLWRGLSSL